MIPDSSAQQSFLRKHKKRQQFIRLMRLAVFLVFLLLWEVSARLGFIDSFIFGSPGQVCLAFRTLLLTNHLLSHIGSENVAEAGKQQQKDTQRITGGFANGRGNELWRSGNISGKNPDFIQKL